MKLMADTMTVSRFEADVVTCNGCGLSNNDMSISLPNIFAQMTNDDNKNGSPVSTSSTDIFMKFDKRNSLVEDKLKLRTLSLEDCPSVTSSGYVKNISSTSSSGSNPNLEFTSQIEAQDESFKNENKFSTISNDLPITIRPTNNRLSAVLENISLVYLPQTKQLVNVVDDNDIKVGSDEFLQNSEDMLRSGPEGAEDPPPAYNSKHCHSFNQVMTLPFIEPSQRSLSLSSADPSPSSELHASTGVLSQESDISVKSHDTVKLCNGNIHDDNTSQDFEPIPQVSDPINTPDKQIPTDFDLTEQIDQNISKADATSFSSISTLSTGTELSVSVTSDLDTTEKPIEDSEEAGFVEINLDAKSVCDQNLVIKDISQDSGIDEKLSQQSGSQLFSPSAGAKPKKKGLSSFLSRNIFSRKVKDSPVENSPLGWRLFGKIPPKSPTAGQEETPSICGEENNEDPELRGTKKSGGRVKKSDVEAPSTTALILENRPLGLPSKDPEEEQRHRQQYESMVEAARKKEMREAKLRKKQLQQQLKHEDALSAAVKIWNTEILPNWDNMKLTKKARDLWWNGIPPSVRGNVWKLAFGNDLNLTHELYEICLSRAKDRLKLMKESGSDTDSISSFSMFSDLPSSKEASVELIKLDVSRTFPQLCIFQKRGPYYELLQGLLGAYACYRPDVGYVQGMSFIAAVLLLNMDVADAFICFANLLNRPCQVAFFRLDESLMTSYFDTYEEFFEENLPRLFSHFKKLNVTSNLYIIDWLFTMYTKSLPLDVACRVWDVYCRDGEESLFRTALGILKLHEHLLLEMDFIHLAQFLTRLPENISSDHLFQCVSSIHMSIDKRKFSQVLVDNREKQNREIPDS